MSDKPAQRLAARRVMRSDDAETASAVPASFDFVDVLNDAAEACVKPKGQRTMLRIKAGAAKALSTMPYEALRVADIAQAAGVSHGLFYHYFADKEAVVIAVLEALLVHTNSVYRRIHAVDDPYESIFVPNLFYLDVYRRNAGLLRACLMLSEERETFRSQWNDYVDRWHRRIAGAIRAAGRSDAFLPDAELTAYAVGGMIDQMCRLVYLQHNPFVARLAPDMVQLAETITVLWYRAVNGGDPARTSVEACRARYASN